jgi:hypothetical protein
MELRRVVVTGLGSNPIGNTVEENGINHHASGAAPINLYLTLQNLKPFCP